MHIYDISKYTKLLRGSVFTVWLLNLKNALFCSERREIALRNLIKGASDNIVAAQQISNYIIHTLPLYPGENILHRIMFSTPMQ